MKKMMMMFAVAILLMATGSAIAQVTGTPIVALGAAVEVRQIDDQSVSATLWITETVQSSRRPFSEPVIVVSAQKPGELTATVVRTIADTLSVGMGFPLNDGEGLPDSFPVGTRFTAEYYSEGIAGADRVPPQPLATRPFIRGAEQSADGFVLTIFGSFDTDKPAPVFMTGIIGDLRYQRGVTVYGDRLVVDLEKLGIANMATAYRTFVVRQGTECDSVTLRLQPATVPR